MRSQFLLFPAVLIASAPAQAYHYMSAEVGLAALYPGAEFTPQPFTMEISQVAALMDEIHGESVYSTKIKAWKVSTGGWAFLDQVVAHGAAIIYLVGILPDGTVKAVEVLECSQDYSKIQEPKWLQQFVGKRHNRSTQLVDSINFISGASQSSEALAFGVRRVLAAYTLFYATQGS